MKEYKLILKQEEYEVFFNITEEFLEKMGEDMLMDFIKRMFVNIKRLSSVFE